MYFGRRLVIGCLFTYMKILSFYVIMVYFATSILQSLSIILLALWQIAAIFKMHGVIIRTA